MALEDFFTLTEMNNGLAAPERVKELIALMHKGSDCVINNIRDASRQWSAVASSMALTENKDCLLLFVKLDGLIYMNRWLKDASEFVNKTNDKCVEETIIDILRALTRIDASCDKLLSSGICMTVKDLIGRNNPNVRDMAKSLLEMWDKETPRESVMKVEDTGMPDNAERGVSEQHADENGNLRLSNGDFDASKGSLTSEIRQEIGKGGLLSTASETLKYDEIKKTSSDGAFSNEDVPYSTNTGSFQEPGKENLNKLEPPISCSEATPSTEACRLVGPKQGTHGEDINDSELDPTKTGKLTQKMDSSLQIFEKEQDPKGTLGTNDTGTLDSHTEPSDIKDNDDNYAEEKDYAGEVSNCLKTDPSEADKKMNCDKSSGYDRNIMSFRSKGGGENNSNVMEVSNTTELKPKHVTGSGGLFQRSGDLGVVQGCIHDKVEGCFAKEFDFSKQKNGRKDHRMEKSDFDLDYGIADPLELARLVAIEVEREVEDRELSCSASDQELSSKVQGPESSHSITGERCQAESSTAEVSSQHDVSLDSPTSEHLVTSGQGLDLGSQEARSPQLTEAAEVVEASTDAGLCHFDLNQDVCLEDVEHQEDTLSHPVSVVSASRAVAAPLMHVGPPQFEGALGWKGSAATSAFRPASPRRVPESDFSLSAGGSNSSSKENHSLLNINLNVAENRDNNQIPASLESSAGASSKRSERLEFDLNQISDVSAPLDLQLEQNLFHQRSGRHNQSSSSSSSKLPSLRNIDLNDQPIVANDLSSSRFYLKPSQSLISSGSVKSGDSVITIMGRRVEVNQRNCSGKSVPLSNGRISEPIMGFNVERPGGLLVMGSSASYPEPQIQGVHGLPFGSSIPFSSPIYGSGGAIPYMVDSRGVPIVPQIMPYSTSSTISTAFAQPAYLFSMAGMPSVNGVAMSRDNFDLNSSMYTEGRDRDLGGFRQLFHPPQPRHFDEHLKSDSQPSTSSSNGVGGKRKEPEDGWESYPFKQHPQPWR